MEREECDNTHCTVDLLTAFASQMGGRMEAVEWPPDSLSDMED